MRDVYIINPTAGKQDSSANLIEQIKLYYGNDAKIIITEGVGDAKIKAEKEAKTGDEVRIFACGGDGTCFEVLNGIVGYENASLGVIPIGSANDFLKFFGKNSKKDFLDIEKQKYGKLVPVDLIKAGEYYCLNQCCAGMDAMVADDMKIFKRLPLVNGPTAYNLAIVKTLLRKLGIKAKLIIDNDKEKEGRFLFAVCANAPAYGGGYMSAPNSNPFDGVLNWLSVDVISRLRILKFLPLYKAGKHENLDICSVGECQTFEIITEKPIPVSLDGEILHTKNIKCEIVKKAIKFVVPENILTN
ncbi:MAG: YegS/Rv2252/BmrU family lipid kinase [Clostridia bacterium]|nr:YegS/Rv2252/BmrU family lipid kinase [Clostridia bacterium]